MGLTKAIFAPFEKELLFKSLSIMLHKWESIMLDDSFTNCGKIVSGPVAFLILIFF